MQEPPAAGEVPSLRGDTAAALESSPGQRQQPVGMSWADGKVNHSAETWAQSHLKLQFLKSVPFSNSSCVAGIVFIQLGGFTGFSVKLKYK